MSLDKNVPKAQRALVLQGGGALGGYESGVLKMLTRNLRMEDKENGETIDGLKTNQSTKLIDLTVRFRTSLD